MPTLGDRWRAFREAMARRAARRSWSRVLQRSREALDAATKPTRDFLEAERARFEAARRRRELREAADAATRDAATPDAVTPDAPEGDDPR